MFPIQYLTNLTDLIRIERIVTPAGAKETHHHRVVDVIRGHGLEGQMQGVTSLRQDSLVGVGSPRQQLLQHLCGVLADPGCRVRQLTTNHHVGVLDQIAVETLHQLQKGRFFIGPVWQLGVTNGEIVDLSPNVEVVIIGHNPARCIMCC
jgi:hypothetical protein